MHDTYTLRLITDLYRQLTATQEQNEALTARVAELEAAEAAEPEASAGK